MTPLPLPENSSLQPDALRHSSENPKALWNLFVDYNSWYILVLHRVGIAHCHYKLHQEGLRYPRTIPGHPLRLMQHLSP